MTNDCKQPEMMWGGTSKGIVMLPHLTSEILSKIEGEKIQPDGDPIERMRKARDAAERLLLLRSN